MRALASISIQKMLYAVTSILAVLLIAAMIYQAQNAVTERRVALSVETSNETADLLLSAAAHWAVERGRVNASLGAPAVISPEDLAAIEGQRHEADDGFEKALARLRATAGASGRRSQPRWRHGRPWAICVTAPTRRSARQRMGATAGLRRNGLRA